MQKFLRFLSLVSLLSIGVSGLSFAAKPPVQTQRYYSCQLLLKNLVVIKQGNTCIWRAFAVGGPANDQDQTTPTMMYALQFQGNAQTDCKPTAQAGVTNAHVVESPPYDVGYECQFQINGMQQRPQVSVSNAGGFLGTKCTLNSAETLITCVGQPTI